VKLQKKHERWQCAVTSFAMALDCPVVDLMLALGHDGSEIIYPDLPEPSNRHGHNIYELIQVALDMGYAVTPVPLKPAIVPACDRTREFVIGNEKENSMRFVRNLLTSRGIIECYGPRGPHVVAYDNGVICDPEGDVFPYSIEACEERDYHTYCLWRVDRIAP
jgi:hypothetical protein